MSGGVNEARGEVELKLGKRRLVLCCSPDSLARLSSAINAKTMSDIATRIMGMEPAAMLAVVRAFTIDGDAEAALSALKGRDYQRICESASAALLAHMDSDHEEEGQKKTVAGRGSRSETSPSGD